MKKLEFYLKNNNDIIIHDFFDYTYNNERLVFNINEIEISVLFSKDSKIFIRKTAEDSFVIKQNLTKVESYIELLKDNIKIDVDVANFVMQKEDNHILVSYSIVGDDNNQKNIDIYL